MRLAIKGPVHGHTIAGLSDLLTLAALLPNLCSRVPFPGIRGLRKGDSQLPGTLVYFLALRFPVSHFPLPVRRSLRMQTRFDDY